jgi:hypothetical protein
MRYHPVWRERSATALTARVLALVRALRDGDQAMVEDAVLRLSRSRRWLAPLAFAVGALVMLFDGLRLVLTNWRLMIIQILPAMWIWAAMLDLKLHVLHGRTFHLIRGPIVIPIVIVMAAITAACFFLNAVFAFAIAGPGSPEIRPAIARAREHLGVVLGSGFVVGVLLGLCTVVLPRAPRPWFTLCLSVVIGVMMVSYVALPSRLIGIKSARSRRDKIVASAVSGTLGAVVSAPAYVLGRVGILMLGVSALFIPGLVVVAVGFALQAGTTGAVKAIKMSASLAAGRIPPVTDPALGGSGPAP